jgi:hypothetical protein
LGVLKSLQIMTPRSLFNIILKIIGIFLIKDILYPISQIFIVISNIASSESRLLAIWTLVTILIILIVQITFCYWLVFKTDRIIDILKLDKGFDQETIPLNIHRSTILSISIIVIGGLLIADELPDFFRQVLIYFLQKHESLGRFNPNIQYMVLAVFKVLVGVLLIAKQRQLVNLIERQRKKKPVQ